jgi:hypothetical protein
LKQELGKPRFIGARAGRSKGSLEKKLAKQSSLEKSWEEKRILRARAWRSKGSLEQNLGTAKVHWSQSWQSKG